MSSRVRRQGRACITTALLLSVAFSAVAPAQARPPQHHPAVQSSAPSTKSAAPAPTWTAIEHAAAAAEEHAGFWVPIFALVVAWKAAIKTLVIHVWKGENNDSEVCS